MPKQITTPKASVAGSARSHRPLYLKHVPSEIWERLHIEAIQRDMTITDHVLSFLKTAEPTTPPCQLPKDEDSKLFPE